MGMTPVKQTVQLRSMDQDLRNGLWSVFVTHVLDPDTQARAVTGSYSVNASFFWLYRVLWFDFFKTPVDLIPQFGRDTHKTIRAWYFEAKWYQVYDFVEFMVAANLGRDFEDACSRVLAREVAGYRLVAKKLTPISDENELAAITMALEASQKTKLTGVREHLGTALALLSDRQTPDYRNSIKESISAVESLARVITGDDKADLAKALKTIETVTPVHGGLKKGFLALYGYTSDASGIRHGMSDEPTADFIDAKYMLATCSAFVNFLIARAGTAGITF